jgi:hypothetical protein
MAEAAGNALLAQAEGAQFTGQGHFAAGEFQDAVTHYNKAVQLLQWLPPAMRESSKVVSTLKLLHRGRMDANMALADKAPTGDHVESRAALHDGEALLVFEPEDYLMELTCAKIHETLGHDEKAEEMAKRVAEAACFDQNAVADATALCARVEGRSEAREGAKKAAEEAARAAIEAKKSEARSYKESIKYRRKMEELAAQVWRPAPLTAARTRTCTLPLTRTLTRNPHPRPRQEEAERAEREAKAEQARAFEIVSRGPRKQAAVGFTNEVLPQPNPRTVVLARTPSGFASEARFAGLPAPPSRRALTTALPAPSPCPPPPLCPRCWRRASGPRPRRPLCATGARTWRPSRRSWRAWRGASLRPSCSCCETWRTCPSWWGCAPRPPTAPRPR